MMKHPALVENEEKRLNLRLPWLICFAMFAAWQMGMVYFSGQTLSVDGRTPLPVHVDDVTLIIVAGYSLSILVMLFMPHIIVWLERVTASLALLTGLALFLPFSPDTMTLVLYVQYFCCCFMIGFETAIMIGLFSEKTTILYLTLAYGVANALVAILQNEFVKVDFTVFRLFSVAALAMMLAFFFKLPTGVWLRTVKKVDGLPVPKSLFVGIFFWTIISCFTILFGSAVAEGIKYGISVFYCSSALFGVLLYLLWKNWGLVLFKAFTVYIAMGAIGFVLAIASLYVPFLGLPTCVLLGGGSVCCWMTPFFGVLLAKQYPSRYIAPGIIALAFLTVIIHSVLLNVLRNHTTILYDVYLVIAVSLIIVYLMLSPYLAYAYQDKTSSSGETVRAESTPSATPDWREMLQANAYDKLSEGELDIAGYIMQGYQNAEISAETRYSLETVKTYRKRLYGKLDIHKPRELFVRAARLVKDEER